MNCWIQSRKSTWAPANFVWATTYVRTTDTLYGRQPIFGGRQWAPANSV